MMTMLDEASGAAMDNLYPALAQCFVIIICGYFAGRIHLISETEAKGINTFVGTFALPSLIFMSLAELDLSSVNWLFLLSILIAKSVVFFAVIVVTLLVGRPINFGRAGIFAIFCTQSNDFAIGYPIVVALYQNTHPEYASYLYLMAPISLAILNPLSFILMEIGKRKAATDLSPLSVSSSEDSFSVGRQKLRMVISVAKNIFLNPIIMMTILGIFGNFIFTHNVPIYIAEILKALGSAFSASALFLLGLRMVGKVHKLRGATLIVPGLLIIAKLLVLPLVTRQVINLVDAGYNSSETTDLSTYGFLYGTFPAAPTVFVFATQYALDIDLIASAMVACTFISAPLMFVSAKMITLTKTDPAGYIKQLDAFTLDVSIAGTVACVWVLLLYILTKKINRVPHKITACLIVSQLLSCIGAILWNSLDKKEGWPGYIQFSVFSIGVYSSRLWTAILAVALLFLQCRSLCFVLKLQPVFILTGWGLPIILSVLLLLFDKSNSLPFDKRNPSFVYGVFQAVIAVSLLVLCFIVTVGCLILHERHRRRYERYCNLANDVASTFEHHTTASDSEYDSGAEVQESRELRAGTSNPSNGNALKKEKCGSLPTIKEGCCEESPVVDIEDILSGNSTSDLDGLRVTDDGMSPSGNGLCPSHFGCEGPRREECHGILQRYQEQADENTELIEEEPDTHDPQILKHVILLILLLCSMFVGLALSVWTLIMEQMSGIYIELSFLDATLNFGQSIIVFAVFGTDTKDLVLPLLCGWRKMWYGANTLVLPSFDELSTETRHKCDQFLTHHLDKCRKDIAQDKRWRIKVYKDVFPGVRFVNWLIEVGLARDRVEAVNYARHLIEGKVLKHINGVYHFYDRNLLYTFN